MPKLKFKTKAKMNQIRTSTRQEILPFQKKHFDKVAEYQALLSHIMSK